ncbi:MAG: uracil-DNA glycosylase [Methyloligellaceae bacterium]
MKNEVINGGEDVYSRVLQWYGHMGVDEVLEDHPLDWFELSEKQVKQPVTPKKPMQSSAPLAAPTSKPQSRPVTRSYSAVPPDNAVNDAREKVKTAKTLQELEDILRSFEGCGLKATAKNTCIYRGSPDAKLMMIGEAPGRDEDIQGVPFVGRAGQLLDKMLAAIGHDEKNTYITNIVYWRPPGNRTPTPQEAQICLPFLIRQIELIKPQVLVFLGGAAAKHMLNTNDGIMKLRGKWKEMEIGGAQIKAIATLHPAYLLRTPAGKKLAWKDFLAIRQEAGLTD